MAILQHHFGLGHGFDGTPHGVLTRRQRELLEEFERESHKETSPQSAGFFARVKDFFDGKGA